MTLRTTSAKRQHRPGHDERRSLYLNAAFVVAIIAALAILLGAAGVSYYTDHFGQVASVNGKVITRDDLTARVAVDTWRIDHAEKGLVNLLASGRITQAEQNAQGTALENERKALPQSSLDALVKAELESQLATGQGVSVTEAQIDAQIVVESTSKEYRHVLAVQVAPQAGNGETANEATTAAKTKIDAAYAQVKAGTDFATVAKATSTGPDASTGGDIGWLSADSAVDPALLAAVQKLEVNGLTEVLLGSDGVYRFAKLVEIDAAKPDPNWLQSLRDASVSVDAYRAVVRAELLDTALQDKVTASAVDVPSLMRLVSEISIQGTPGGTPVDEVKASHILISPNGDPQAGQSLPPDDSAWTTAKTEADAIFAQIQADPTQFEALAKAKSNDTGSGSGGGALPWFKESDVDATFGTAIFQLGLRPGQILGPVRTVFGYHIIRFDGRRADGSVRINDLRQQVLAGGDFAELAKANSDAVDATTGGEMGWIAKNQLSPELEAAIFAAPIGKVSDVTSGTDGWYLYLVQKEETRLPDAAQAATLKKTVFQNWYDAEKAKATIVQETVAASTTQ